MDVKEEVKGMSVVVNEHFDPVLVVETSGGVYRFGGVHVDAALSKRLKNREKDYLKKKNKK